MILSDDGRRRLRAVAEGRATAPLAPWQARMILETDRRMAEHDRAEN